MTKKHQCEKTKIAKEENIQITKNLKFQQKTKKV